MDGAKPVFWYQGLFLQPQHFQLSEQFLLSQLRAYQQQGQPHAWGVTALDLQDSALEHRRCELESGEFLFPDGSVVNFPGNAVIRPRSFEDAWVEADKPFTIYVGLRKLSPFEDNVTVVSDFDQLEQVRTRFVSLADPQEVRDLYRDGPQAQVKSMHYVLRVIWETEKDDMTDYLLIPIAEVSRQGEGIGYTPDYSPPVLNVLASPNLLRTVKEIRDEITGRAAQLSGYEPPPGQASSRFDATMMRYKLASRTLSRFIPRMFHYTDDGGAHPWQIYGTLREMLGEISTFTDRVNALGETPSGERLLPGYQHAAPGACFAAARALVTQLLNEITIGPQFLVEMPFDGTCYTAAVPPEFFSQKVDFYLVVNTQSNFSDYEHSLLTAAKLSSREMVETLAERSLPGVAMIHVPLPPAELPRRADAHYVRLDIHGEEWGVVERHRDLALLWEDAPPEVSVDLVIVRS